jgi:Dolichyl-phosphate-mannose-protein mannosyltransferase
MCFTTADRRYQARPRILLTLSGARFTGPGLAREIVRASLPSQAMVDTATEAPARRLLGTSFRRDALLLAVGTVLIRLPDFVAPRHLSYDDGGYLSAALAMRDGELPFRDIFSSQGPLFLPLVWLADLVGFRTHTAPRLLAVAAGVGVTLAVYAAGRRVTSRGGALLAGGLVATSGSVLWVSGPLTGDGVAMAFAVTAVALALRFRDSPSLGGAVAVGLVMGAAMSVKAIAVPAAIPIGLIFLATRRVRDFVVAVACAGAVWVTAALPWGIGRVWEQAFEYHRASAREDSYFGNAVRLVETLFERDLAVVVTALLAAGFLLARRFGKPREPGSPSPFAIDAAWVLLAGWFIAQVIFLVVEPAMWRPHVAHLIPPLALLACLQPPPWRWLAVAAIPVIPWWAAHVQPVLWPRAYGTEAQAAVGDIEALPDGAWVITDEPGLAWAAHRRSPADLVDSSIKRIQQGQITGASLAEGASDPRVCGVLVWTSRFGDFTDLPDRLRAEGYRVEARYDGDRVLYERVDCAP